MPNTVKSIDLSLVERLLRKDRMIVITAVTGIILLAALYTVMGVGMDMSALDMTYMARSIGEPMQMIAGAQWGVPHTVFVFLMWWVMMIAMMTPSAAPTLLLFIAIKRHGKDTSHAAVYGLLFLVGYLLCWAVFSLIVTILQWGAGVGGVVSPSMMAINSKTLAGIIMILAGLYQFSNLKNACLKHCQSPAYFLSENKRDGGLGALAMGIHHGVYCLGCCWALMALLFVGGVMNLYWIVGLALYVLIEKTVAFGEIIPKIFGGAIIAAGTIILFTAWL